LQKQLLKKLTQLFGLKLINAMSTQSKNNNKEQYKSMVEPSYYAIIPANVRYSRDVCDGAKLLYAEITSLSNQHGYCWASNRYFSELYGKSEDTISRWISSLARAGFILTIVDSVKGNSRKIWLAHSQAIRKNADTLSAKMPIPYPQKCGDPIGKNADIILKENNKRNSKGEEEKPSVISQTPAPSQAENFFPSEQKEKAPPVPAAPPANYIVTTTDADALPGALVRVAEHVVFPGSPSNPISATYRTDLPTRAADGDEAGAIITAWTALNIETVKNKYSEAKRAFASEDLQKLIVIFCGQYSSNPDSGTMQRFLSDPALFFKNKLSSWLMNQDRFDKMAAPRVPSADAPKPVHSRIPRY